MKAFKVFKTGDKVRVIKSYPNWINVGEILEVTLGNEDGSRRTVCVKCISRNNSSGGFSADHFEHIVKTLEEMTDEELADEFRDLHNRSRPVLTELRNRGFYMTTKSGSPVTILDTFVFKKEIKL